MTQQNPTTKVGTTRLFRQLGARKPAISLDLLSATDPKPTASRSELRKLG